MPLNRLQQIIAERKAAREQTDTLTEEGEEPTVTTRTRGEARKEAKEVMRNVQQLSAEVSENVVETVHDQIESLAAKPRVGSRWEAQSIKVAPGHLLIWAPRSPATSAQRKLQKLRSAPP